MRKLCIPIAVALALISCSKPKQIPWSEEMAVWFGNAAAQPTDPPHAHWTSKEEELFLKRVGYADLTVLGVVSSVGTYVRYEDPRQITLTFLPLHVFYGSLEDKVDTRGELVLKLGDDALDFRRALQTRRYLPARRYLLLLKQKPYEGRERPKGAGWKASLWRPPPKPKPIYRWALYKPERKLLEQVRALYQILKRTKK